MVKVRVTKGDPSTPTTANGPPIGAFLAANTANTATNTPGGVPHEERS